MLSIDTIMAQELDIYVNSKRYHNYRFMGARRL